MSKQRWVRVMKKCVLYAWLMARGVVMFFGVMALWVMAGAPLGPQGLAIACLLSLALLGPTRRQWDYLYGDAPTFLYSQADKDRALREFFASEAEGSKDV